MMTTLEHCKQILLNMPIPRMDIWTLRVDTATGETALAGTSVNEELDNHLADEAEIMIHRESSYPFVSARLGPTYLWWDLDLENWTWHGVPGSTNEGFIPNEVDRHILTLILVRALRWLANAPELPPEDPWSWADY